jgi:ABC-type transport system involved in cytochrome c biogenesis permease component
VAWKDLLVERRSKETLNSLLFFSLALLFVFQFALDADRERLSRCCRACCGWPSF